MATRTAYVGTQAAGDVLTSANFTTLPGGLIAYARASANQTGITTITDLTSLAVSPTIGANRMIRITGQARVTRTVADGYTTLYIREGSTKLNYALNLTSLDETLFVQSIEIAPSAGSHTYVLSLERTTGTGTAGIDALTDHRAFLLVEDLGPSF